MNKLNCLQTEGNLERGLVQNLYVDESKALVYNVAKVHFSE